MKLLTLAAIPALALAAGLSLAACSTSSPTSVPTHTATPTPSAAATSNSPVGVWNVAATSAPVHILGQYSITQPAAGSDYVMTIKAAFNFGSCSVPAGIREGTFAGAASPNTYAGTETLWNTTNCAEAHPSTFTATLSSDGNTIVQQIANSDPASETLTRVGNTPAATPPLQTTPTSSAASTAPAGALPTVAGVNPPYTPQVRPSAILLFADGSFALEKITWSSWTATGASGSGTLYSSNGNPSMATGAKSYIAVSIALSAPTSGSKPFFTRMVVTDGTGRTDTFAATNKYGMVGQTTGITAPAAGSNTPASSSAPSGYTDCGGRPYDVYAGPSTSCSFALSVAEEYHATGTAMPSSGSRSIDVYSSVTGRSYAMECANAGMEVTCTGGNNASVEFTF